MQEWQSVMISEMTSIRVRPWEVRKGDRILGTSMVANGPAKYVGFIYADAVDQQRYALSVTHDDGSVGKIVYSDMSWVHVLRESEEDD